jgi:hypothetical protein
MKITNLVVLFSMVFCLTSQHLIAMEEDTTVEESTEESTEESAEKSAIEPHKKYKRQSRVVRTFSKLFVHKVTAVPGYQDETMIYSEMTTTDSDLREDNLREDVASCEIKLQEKAQILYKIMKGDLSFRAINRVLKKYPEARKIMHEGQNTIMIARERNMPKMAAALYDINLWDALRKNKPDKAMKQKLKAMSQEELKAWEEALIAMRKELKEEKRQAKAASKL